MMAELGFDVQFTELEPTAWEKAIYSRRAPR